MRITALKGDPDAEVAGLAAKIDREEAYHRMHAEMWHERLRDEPRFRDAVAELWPYAVALLPEALRPELAARAGLELPNDSLLRGKSRGEHTADLAELWDEMTSVRRSAPAGSQW